MNMGATTYKEFNRGENVRSKLRNMLRERAIHVLSLGQDIKNKFWIRFPYYHHVFDDEVADFDRQLKFMRNYGDFISLENVINILEAKEKINGNYFCITFDDGFKNCLTNACDVLSKHGCIAFFIPTDYIGLNMEENKKINGVLQRSY